MSTSADWRTVAEGFDAYVLQPHTGNGHAVVLLQEIFGINEALRDTGQMMADGGYLVAIPDLFWRMQRRISLGYGQDEVKTAFSYAGRLDDRLAVEDIAATVRNVRAAAPGACVHLVGFCLGGRLAVLGSGTDDVASAISLYGVGIERNLAALERARCPLQLHFAGRDRFVPREAVATIEQAAVGRAIEIHHYPDAGHGFFARKRPGYDKSAADAAWARMTRFMHTGRSSAREDNG